MQALADRVQRFTKPQRNAAARDVAKATDDQLLAWYLQGDNQAFEALYRRHKDPLFRFFRRQLDEPASHDAFQETWSKLINNAARYKAEDKFKHYLFTIAYNVLHDHYRKTMRTLPEQTSDPDLVETEVPGKEDTEASAQTDELRQHLLNAIQTLPQAQRHAWLLKQEAGFTLNEIAALTNSTTESVKSRVRYATDKLKTRMQKYV